MRRAGDRLCPHPPRCVPQGACVPLLPAPPPHIEGFVPERTAVPPVPTCSSASPHPPYFLRAGDASELGTKGLTRGYFFFFPGIEGARAGAEAKRGLRPPHGTNAHPRPTSSILGGGGGGGAATSSWEEGAGWKHPPPPSLGPRALWRKVNPAKGNFNPGGWMRPEGGRQFQAGGGAPLACAPLQGAELGVSSTLAS